MLMSPPPSGSYNTSAVGPAAQSMQLLGSPQNTQQANPQMMRMLMQLSGQGGFSHGQGPSLGPVQQGMLGSNPPQPNQGGFR